MGKSERTSTTTIELGIWIKTRSRAVIGRCGAQDMASDEHEPHSDKQFLNVYAHIITREKPFVEATFGVSISYDGRR